MCGVPCEACGRKRVSGVRLQSLQPLVARAVWRVRLRLGCSSAALALARSLRGESSREGTQSLCTVTHASARRAKMQGARDAQAWREWMTAWCRGMVTCG